jgi:hypothetical protein
LEDGGLLQQLQVHALKVRFRGGTGK